MDRFLAPHTPEAVAYSHISQNYHDWDLNDSNVDSRESLISLNASYNAFDRYLRGTDLFIMPRTRSELESVLRRYATDNIHSSISRSRLPLQAGGYSRIVHLAENSIADVLSTGDNVAILLSLHLRSSTSNNHERNNEWSQTIRTK